ncbi:hypothetical protein [Massilia rubra]|uniref:Uncharacterized protein n=1 Tax=Massilia rubra TaxID=2607910 RepID=A0ABX0M117_9BURK|nr:hypothetical protein [Massilia rubra]NHZ35961.1 hypothetical protein [Massilia rubra]
MTMPPQRRALLTFLAIALVSAACNATSNNTVPVDQGVAPAAVKSAPGGTSDAPDIDLWAPFLAVAAGNYTAQCKSLSIPPQPAAKQNGPLIIAADGTLHAGSVVGNLKPARTASLNRSRDISGKPLLSVSIASKAGSFGAVEQDDGTKQAAFGRTPNMFECRLAEKVQPGTQSIYVQFAGFFDAASKMTCRHVRTRKVDKADYEMAKGVLTIGTTRFDLNTLKDENLIMWPEEGFSYSGNTDNDSSFDLDLDMHGKPKHLKLMKKGRNLIECSPLR